MIIRTDRGTFSVPDSIHSIKVTTPKSRHEWLANHAAMQHNMLRQAKDSIKTLVPLGQETYETDTDITTIHYFATPGGYIEI